MSSSNLRGHQGCMWYTYIQVDHTNTHRDRENHRDTETEGTKHTQFYKGNKQMANKHLKRCIIQRKKQDRCCATAIVFKTIVTSTDKAVER